MVLTGVQKSLVVAGATLFLLGLLQGAGVPMFANPRMALSAHLTAVQSGTALMVVGAIWPGSSLGRRTGAIARAALVIGFYGLWIGLTVSAITGASRTLPIAGQGHSAGETAETIVSAMVMGSSALMTMGWIVFLWGLVRSARRDA